MVNLIKKISDEATRFAKDNTKGTPLGDISSYKDISNLANSIDTMETDMVQYVENLTTAAKERSRLGAELKLAGKIQENSIPNVFPPFPDRHEFDLYASMTPAKSVGGDFYNFFLVDEDHLVMMIGDVSGKGVPAAMFMMVTNIMITDRIQMGGSPAEVLEFVNNQLCEHNKENMFVTLWLGVLEISSGRVTAVNAGHECPVVQSDGLFSLLKDKHGFVTGGMPNVKYVNYEIQLKPGDKLFLYTDGAPEATDADNKLFGLDRMLEVLNAKPEDRPELVIGNIHEAVAQFVGETTQFDDLTMLCMEYRGSEDKENDC